MNYITSNVLLELKTLEDVVERIINFVKEEHKQCYLKQN